MDQPDAAQPVTGQPDASAAPCWRCGPAYLGPAQAPQYLSAADRDRRRANGHLLRGIGSALTLLGQIVLDKVTQDAEEFVTQAYRDGHKHGWHQRGEQLGPEAH